MKRFVSETEMLEACRACGVKVYEQGRAIRLVGDGVDILTVDWRNVEREDLRPFERVLSRVRTNEVLR